MRLARSPLVAALAGVVCAAVLAGPVPGAWASSACPNEEFRTGAGANLPDCRAYELVSPPNENGGEVDGGLDFEVEPVPMQAAPGGEAITYGSQTTFPEADPESSVTTSQYISRRGPGGWSTQAITPRQDLGHGVSTSDGSVDESLYQGFSEDLAHSFLVAGEPAPVAEAPAGEYFEPYLRDDEDGAFTLLSTGVPSLKETGPGDSSNNGLVVEYAGMSTDGSHVIFAANEALTPKAAPGRTNLYEWVEGRGLELVSVLPNGKPDEGGDVHPLEITNQGLSFGGYSEEAVDGVHSNYDHAISTDGTRVFWTGSSIDHQVYMHEVTATGARTVEVSASQKTNGSGPGGTDPHGPLPAHYWTASANGSLVYFTSCAQLTNDSTAEFFEESSSQCKVNTMVEPIGARGQDLYQYNVETGVLSDLTVDDNPGETASVQGVLGASENGSYVYFVAMGVLAEGAVAGKFNLYVWHEGVTSFIAALGSDVEGETVSDGEEAKDWDQGLIVRTSRVAPDGEHLAFQSEQALTGYDNLPVNPETCQEAHYFSASKRCMEVYEYSMGSGGSAGSLVCASCNPSGLPPTGNSVVPGELSALEDVTRGWQTSTVQQRYLSNDGGRLFFTSKDALLPLASDGEQNVYEYERDGEGSCEGAGGCVYLISGGTSGEPSYFVDASADGSDVFLLTQQQLVPQDGDDAFNLYDARVDGGFAAPSVPSCSGEACRPPVSPAPSIYGPPTSATFVGASVPAPAPAATGKPTTTKKPKKKTKKQPKKKKSRKKKAKKKASKSDLRSRGRRKGR